MKKLFFAAITVLFCSVSLKAQQIDAEYLNPTGGWSQIQTLKFGNTSESVGGFCITNR